MNHGLSVDGEEVYWHVRLATPNRTEHCESCAASLFCVTGKTFCLMLCHVGCGRVMGINYAPSFVRGLFGDDRDYDLYSGLSDSVLRCVARGHYGTDNSYTFGQCLPCQEEIWKRRRSVEELAARGGDAYLTIGYIDEPTLVREKKKP
jgi:hypothetical protein